MKKRWLSWAIVLLVLIMGAAEAGIVAQVAQQKGPIQYVETETGRWMVHDENRPAPPLITPGSCEAQWTPAKPKWSSGTASQ